MQKNSYREIQFVVLVLKNKTRKQDKRRCVGKKACGNLIAMVERKKIPRTDEDEA